MKQAIYTCFPFRSDPKGNTDLMKKVSARLWELGHVPLCPHITAAFFNDGDVDALNYCIELLRRCDVLLVCSNHISAGMKTEIAWWSKYRKGQAIRFWDMEKMDFEKLEVAPDEKSA